MKPEVEPTLMHAVRTDDDRFRITARSAKALHDAKETYLQYCVYLGNIDLMRVPPPASQ